MHLLTMTGQGTLWAAWVVKAALAGDVASKKTTGVELHFLDDYYPWLGMSRIDSK
jgi:hypothetical protein